MTMFKGIPYDNGFTDDDLNECQAVFFNIRNTVRTPDQLSAAIKNNWHAYAKTAIMYGNKWGNVAPRYKTDQYILSTKVKVSELDIYWKDNIPITHDAPIGVKRNWAQEKEKGPIGFPGWRGSIKYKVSGEKSGRYEFDGNTFEGSGINTGSGGFAGAYYYSLNLYAQDWPAMTQSWKCAMEFKRLTLDNRHELAIVIDLFDTYDKVRKFLDNDLEIMRDHYQKAYMWGQLKGDKRHPSFIVKELFK